MKLNISNIFDKVVGENEFCVHQLLDKRPQTSFWAVALSLDNSIEQGTNPVICNRRFNTSCVRTKSHKVLKLNSHRPKLTCTK